MQRLLTLIIFLLALLSGASSNAIASGEVIRQGPVVVFKTDCLAFNLDALSQTLPEGRTTFNELVFLFAARLRDLTAAERALCNGTEVMLPTWKVHDNGNITRPAYTFAGGLLTKHKTARAIIGEPCLALVSKVANHTKLEYRQIADRADRPPNLAAICELK